MKNFSKSTKARQRILSAVLCIALAFTLVDPSGIFNLVQEAYAAGGYTDPSVGLGHGSDSSQMFDPQVNYVATGNKSGIFQKTFHMPILEVTLTRSKQTALAPVNGLDQVFTNLGVTTPIAGTGTNTLGTSIMAMSPHLYSRITDEGENGNYNVPLGFAWYDSSKQTWQIKGMDDMGSRLLIKQEGSQNLPGETYKNGLYYDTILKAIKDATGKTDPKEFTTDDLTKALGNGKWKTLITDLEVGGTSDGHNKATKLWSYFLQNVGTEGYGWAENAAYGVLDGKSANSHTDYSNVIPRINNFLNIKGSNGSKTQSTGKVEIDLNNLNEWYYDSTKAAEHIEYKLRYLDLLMSYYAVMGRTINGVGAKNQYNNTYDESVHRANVAVEDWLAGAINTDEGALTLRISACVGFYVGEPEMTGLSWRGAVCRVDEWMAYYGGVTPQNIWVTDLKYNEATKKVDLNDTDKENKVFTSPGTHAKYLWAIWNSMGETPGNIGPYSKRPVQLTTAEERAPLAWAWASTVMTYGHVYDTLNGTEAGPNGSRIWYWPTTAAGVDASQWGYSTILVPFPDKTDPSEILGHNAVYGINGQYNSLYLFTIKPPLPPSLAIKGDALWLPQKTDSINITTETIGHPSEITIKATGNLLADWQPTLDNLGSKGKYKVKMTIKRETPNTPNSGVKVVSAPGNSMDKLLTTGADWSSTELEKFLRGDVGIIIQDTDIGSFTINENETKNFEYPVTLEVKFGPETVEESKMSVATGTTTVGVGADVTPTPPGVGGDTVDNGNPKIDVTRAYKPDTRMWISSPYTYSEIKDNTIYKENFEAMAGVPTTDTLYFASGGSEFIVDIEAVRIENATAVRKYRSYFDGDECEFKQGDAAPNQTLGEQSANLHGGSVHTKTWTGSVPNNGSDGPSVSGYGHGSATSTSVAVPDRTAYNADKAAAIAFAAAVNATTLSFTSASDKVNRSHTGWSAGITTDTVNDPQNTTATSSGTCSESTDSDGHTSHTYGSGPSVSAKKSGPGNYTITVTWTVPAHIICGPCCQHNLPAVEDTWIQRVRYDYMKITDLHVWKIDQSSVDGMSEIEVDDTDIIQAKIQQGEPNIFYNVAQTETSEAGRLRYNIEPQQHDYVQWHETGIGNGTKRSRTCNGIVSHTDNEEPVTDAGHENSWGHGILYNNPSYGTRADTGLCEGYNEIDPGRLNTATANLADNYDWATPEAERFEQRRTTKVQAVIISDMLILQTSSGDQSVLYYEAPTEVKETQQDFVKWDEEASKIEVPIEKMWEQNTNCAGLGYQENGSMGRDAVSWINGGSYNGEFTQTTKKYEGTGDKAQIQTKFDSNGSEWDATSTAHAEKNAVVVQPKPYRASTIKKVGGNVIASPSLISNQDGTNKGQKRLDRPSNLRLFEDGIEQKLTNPNKSYITGEAEVFWKSILNYHTDDYQVFGTFNNTKDAKYSTTNKPLYNANGYVKTSNYSPDHNKINDIVVHDPVSVEDAMVVGLDTARDQRATLPKGTAGDMIDSLNKLNICPLDPGMCEFRVENCTYYQDTVLASFDFENGATNNVNGQVYDLPSGFTIENSNRFGTGKSLKAFGTRWSIPLSDLGISYNASIKLKVEANFTIPAGTTGTMIASFNKYDYYVPSTTSSTWNTGQSQERKANLDISGTHKIAMVFDFNEVDACELYIDGAKVTNYTRVNGSLDITSDIVGSMLNIGSWNYDNNYPAKFYLDNLTITRMAGSKNHTSACYKAVAFHPNGNNTHVHDETCLELPDGAEVGGGTGGATGPVTPVTFNYTGSVQSYTAPGDGTYKLEVWGASGGKGGKNSSGVNGNGGLGGYSSGTVTLKKGETIYVYVGGKGTDSALANNGYVSGTYSGTKYTNSGGWNGGGTSYNFGGGGGGATDIRTTNGAWNNSTSLNSRLIVAGGGGGAQARNGGAGGGTTGGDGTSGCGHVGKGGTQTAGGQGAIGYNTSAGVSGGFGYGGTGQDGNGNHDNQYGAGGGGGWYGGGSSSSDVSNTDDSGAGGGSGYIGKVTDGKMESGKNTGSGKAVITPIDVKTGNGPVLGLDSVIDMMNSTGNEVNTNKVIGDYTYSGTIQTAKLEPGTYQIETWGAEGGKAYYASAGKGAYSTSTIRVESDSTIKILVGQQGGTGDYQRDWSAGGGGGGTFVAYSNNTPICVAGGGGGAAQNKSNSTEKFSHGQPTQNVMATPGQGSIPSVGKGGIASHASGGGGFYENGSKGNYGYGGNSFVSGGAKQSSGMSSGDPFGGFGGGGSTHGSSGGGAGGGGYTGGNGNSDSWDVGGGGGGSSYYTGTDGFAKGGWESMKAPSGGTETGHSGNGYVRITQLTKITGNGNNTNSTNQSVTSEFNPSNMTSRRDIASPTGRWYADVLVGDNYIYTPYSNLNTVDVWMKNADGSIGSYVTSVNWYSNDSTINNICVNGSSIPSAYTVYYKNGVDTLIGWSYSSSTIYTWDINQSNHQIQNRKTISAPATFSYYGRAVWDGIDTIYFLNGNSNGDTKHLYKYSIASQSAQLLSNISVSGTFGGHFSSYTASAGYVDRTNGKVYFSEAIDCGCNFRLAVFDTNTGTYTRKIEQGSFQAAGTNVVNGNSVNTFAFTVNPTNPNIAWTMSTRSNGLSEWRITGNSGSTDDIYNGATSDITQGTPIDFKYSGKIEQITLPAGQYKLETWGAEGGGSRLSGNTNSGPGGFGGYSDGVLTLTSTTTLYIRAGGAGKSSDTGNAAGGFNGGGQGYAYSNGEPGNGGGGASDIRIGSDSLYARVIVAGGGGGGGEDTGDSHGHGGGTNGVGYNTTYDASQTSAGSGGSFGQGGGTNLGDGGGGGGGWYGGGTLSSTSTSSDTQGGGGGSGYIYTAATASNYPAGCLLNNSYYLESASTKNGTEQFKAPNGSTVNGNTGDGYVRITPISVQNTGSGFGQVTLNNIIKNGSFETTSNWSLSAGAVRDTTQHKFGTTSLKFPAGTATRMATQTGITQPIIGHVYYGRQYIHTSGNSTPADARSEVFNGDGAGKNWVYSTNSGNHSGWDMTSSVNKVTAINSSNFYYRTFAVNPTQDTWTDGYMLVDLTAHFGAGKEPSKEWCDTNLPWFESTYTVDMREDYFREIFGDFVWEKIKTEAGGGITGTGQYESKDFTFSTSQQVFTAPYDGKYTLEAWGGQGGKVDSNSGGLGGYTKGTVTLKAGDKLYIYTGGQGGIGNGGFNGGAFNISASRASGGGMTSIAKKSHTMETAKYVWFHGSSGCTFNGQYHISSSSTTCTACGHNCGNLYTTSSYTTQFIPQGYSNFFSSTDIVMAAGGGGGSAHTTGNGGAGGGTTGGNGTGSGTTIGGLGGGQSQKGSTYKGSVGYRGIGGTANNCPGAGGGGYYGGGGGLVTTSDCANSGGGGSSYIGGVTGGTTSSGVNTGNGKAKITWEIQAENQYDRDKIWEIVKEYINKIPEKLNDGTRNPILICHDALRKNETAIGQFTKARYSNGVTMVDLDNGTKAIKIPAKSTGNVMLDLSPVVQGEGYIVEFEYWTTVSNSAFAFEHHDLKSTSYQYQGTLNHKVARFNATTMDDGNMRLNIKGLGAKTLGDVYITNIHVYNRELYYNTHVCDTSCYIEDVLACQEPHHSGLHYDGSNPICWKACGNDENHKKIKNEATLADGTVIQNGKFINLDYGFDIYFPNIGDFSQAPGMLGIDNLTSTRGKGYVNNMDTTKWTREKRVSFDFNVLYERFEGQWEQYNAGESIELPVTGWSYPYYHFYCELANSEAISAGVQYTVEAINCSPANAKNAPGKIDTSGVWRDYPYISDGANNRDNTDVTNRLRKGDYTSKHSAYKITYIDVVGRIGNLTASDTDDYRFANFFKVPVVADKWIVQGIVKEVYPDLQNNYYGDQVDIRRVAIGTNTQWLDTYGTQSWKAEAPVAFPIHRQKNNIQVLRSEEFKPGYNVLLDISTIGNYMNGKLQIYPYFYVLDTKTSEVIPVDVYLKSNGEFKPINIHGLLNDKNADTSNIYNYTMNMNWTDEAARRNYNLVEKEITDRLSERFQEYVPETNSYKNMTIPAGTNYTLGNAQYLEIALKGRTFIGTSDTYGVEVNIWNKIANTEDWNKQGQRWNFTLGLPSSAVFVRFDGATHQVPDVVNTEEFKDNGRYAVLMCADIYSVGTTYVLQADLADGNNGYIDMNGKRFWLPTNIPRCIAVYDVDRTAKDDIDTIGTH